MSTTLGRVNKLFKYYFYYTKLHIIYGFSRIIIKTRFVACISSKSLFLAFSKPHAHHQTHEKKIIIMNCWKIRNEEITCWFYTTTGAKKKLTIESLIRYNLHHTGSGVCTINLRSRDIFGFLYWSRCFVRSCDQAAPGFLVCAKLKNNCTVRRKKKI